MTERGGKKKRGTWGGVALRQKKKKYRGEKTDATQIRNKEKLKKQSPGKPKKFRRPNPREDNGMRHGRSRDHPSNKCSPVFTKKNTTSKGRKFLGTKTNKKKVETNHK